MDDETLIKNVQYAYGPLIEDRDRALTRTAEVIRARTIEAMGAEDAAVLTALGRYRRVSDWIVWSAHVPEMEQRYTLDVVPVAIMGSIVVEYRTRPTVWDHILSGTL